MYLRGANLHQKGFFMDTSNVHGNVKDLISAMNDKRKTFIRNLFNAIEIKVGKENGKVLYPEQELSLLHLVAIRPMDPGYSDKDFNFFKTLYAQFKAGHVAKQQEEIALQHDASVYIQKQMHAEGRVNPLLKKERDEHSRKAANFAYLAAKCDALIDAINAEQTRRFNVYKEQREKDRLEYEEYLRKQQENKEAVRKAEAEKRAAAAARPKLQGITLYGNGMEALALVAIEMRKAGKFTSERKITKAEAIELIGNEDALRTAFAIAKQNNSEVLGELADYRQLFVKKNGAAVVYGIRE
jgi:hypothetical protein